LFQTAKTGAISEYTEIEETMSPRAMEKIAGWILSVPHIRLTSVWSPAKVDV